MMYQPLKQLKGKYQEIDIIFIINQGFETGASLAPGFYMQEMGRNA